MWLQTTLGWFSIVKAQKSMMVPEGFYVRGRVRDDLVNLCRFMGWPPTRIYESDRTDYRYRVVVSRDELQRLYGKLPELVDYGNFKYAVEAMRSRRELGDSRASVLSVRYVDALHDVWRIGYRLQEDVRMDAKDKKKSTPGPLVEDSTLAGGLDEDGTPVVVPKDADGKAPRKVKPTDPRERKR